MDDKPAPLPPITAEISTKGGCHGESTKAETITKRAYACWVESVLGGETRPPEAATDEEPQNLKTKKDGNYDEPTASASAPGYGSAGLS